MSLTCMPIYEKTFRAHMPAHTSTGARTPGHMHTGARGALLPKRPSRLVLQATVK